MLEAVENVYVKTVVSIKGAETVNAQLVIIGRKLPFLLSLQAYNVTLEVFFCLYHQNVKVKKK